MTTTMRLLPVRTTSALRAVIDCVGPVNAATRALIILGLHAAERSLDGLQREIALLLAEPLTPAVMTMLEQIYQALIAPSTLPAHEQPPAYVVLLSPGDSPAASTNADPADPFASIGVEV